VPFIHATCLLPALMSSRRLPCSVSTVATVQFPPSHYPSPLCRYRSPPCPRAASRPARSPPSSPEHHRRPSSLNHAMVSDLAALVRHGPKVHMVRTLSPVSRAKSHALAGALHAMCAMRAAPNSGALCSGPRPGCAQQ
jgi:hypothetical protein